MQAYVDLFDHKKISQFFSTVPWCLSGALQEKTMLKKALLAERARFGEGPEGVKFSLITPAWNTGLRYMEELIYSCMLQSWPNWELIIVDNGSTTTEHFPVIEAWQQRDQRIKLVKESKNLGISGGRNRALEIASGDLICILDHDDIIHPQVLGAFARVLAKNPDIAMIFTNEVKLTDDSTAITDFYSKPEFSLPGLERTNFICHFAALSRKHIDAIRLPNGEWFQPALDGVEDHDFFLRFTREDKAKVYHLPVFAYFWRVCAGSTASTVGEKPYVYDRAEKMLSRYLQEAGNLARAKFEVVPTPLFPRQLYSIHYQASNTCCASLVIPFRDQWHLTKNLLDSLLKQKGIHRHQIILINNRSGDLNTLSAMANYLRENRQKFGEIVCMDFEEPFNFGKMHNVAVKTHAKHEYLVLINNDVELLNSETLQIVLGELEVHKKTGFVGIRLTLPANRGIQHGGIKVESSPVELGLFHPNHILGNDGDLPYDERAVFANSFAFVATRRPLFDQLGGFEESYFPNGCGDVELAMRGRNAGFDSFYLGTIEAIHHESATRETADESLEEVLLSRTYGKELADGQAHRFSHCQGLDLLSRATGGIYRLPLRYRVADAVNERAKNALGPLHRAVKKMLR